MIDTATALAAEARLARFADKDVDAIREAVRLARTPDEVRALTVALERELVHADWRSWLSHLFPEHCTHAFAAHHEEFWAWVWAIEPGVAQAPLIAAWSRGGAKSTSAELAVVMVGALGLRRYVLYVCATQKQADDHVQNIGAMMQSDRFRRLYPAMGAAEVNQYGSKRGWSRNRLRTASGFTVDAVGLDTATRGVKIDADRPDMIWLDDVDDSKDSSQIVARKIESLKTSILPTGAEHLIVGVAQNIIHEESILARLCGMASEPADFLHGRTITGGGPVPALHEAVIEETGDPEQPYRIVAGEPTWEGQDVDACQWRMDTFGYTSFLVECQHEVSRGIDGIYKHVTFRHCTPDEVPELLDGVVAVDPAVTDTDDSDSQAIQVDALGVDQVLYRLRSWEQRSSPEVVIELAIEWAYELQLSTVLVETDQGGDTWKSVYREARRAVLAHHPEWLGRRAPRFRQEKAGRGHGPKVHRSSQMLADYELARIVHVVAPDSGTDLLERALRRFGKHKPFDLADAGYWGWWWLRRRRPMRGRTAAKTSA